MLGNITEGALIAFLAGARLPAFTAALRNASRSLNIGSSIPRFDEDLNGLLERSSVPSTDLPSLLRPYYKSSVLDGEPSNEALRRMIEVLLTNRVKKCASCHKPNAFTLSVCNQCGSSLAAVQISRTTNVFTGFVFGFSKAGHVPLKISMRHETEKLLVMDDLLALAPLHFNAITTSHYIPDWRYLLLKPQKGLDIILSMFNGCVTASKHLIENPEWSQKFIKQGGAEPFDISIHAGAGFNYPPSQYQLHVQFIAPCMMPFQWAQFIKGVHFTHRRFFPFAYVRDILERLVELGVGDGFKANSVRAGEATKAYCSLFRGLEKVHTPICLNADESLIPNTDNIITFAKNTLGIDYEDYHSTHIISFKKHQSLFSNWKAEDFTGHVLTSFEASSKYADTFVGEQEPDCTTSSDIAVSDKNKIQTYGRPYDAANKPTGCFYTYSKGFDEVQLW